MRRTNSCLIPVTCIWDHFHKFRSLLLALGCHHGIALREDMVQLILSPTFMSKCSSYGIKLGDITNTVSSSLDLYHGSVRVHCGSPNLSMGCVWTSSWWILGRTELLSSARRPADTQSRSVGYLPWRCRDWRISSLCWVPLSSPTGPAEDFTVCTAATLSSLWELKLFFNILLNAL